MRRGTPTRRIAAWVGAAAMAVLVATTGVGVGTPEAGAQTPTAPGASGVQPTAREPDRGAEPTGPQVGEDSVDTTSVSPDGEFTPVTPARILDTRDGTGGFSTAVGSATTIDVQVAGTGGLPTTGVAAAVLNVTVTSTTLPSFLTLWPAGQGRPVVSNLNWVPGQTVANLTTVKVGGGGKVSVYNHLGSTDVVIDVVGFYASGTGPSGSRFHPVGPSRYFDTRDTGTPFGQGESRGFQVTGRNGVPASGVTAVAMNVTVTGSTLGGFVTVSPGDVPTPLASNINFVPGATVPNLVIVRVPPNGLVSFYNRFGSVHLIADVVGWYDQDRLTESGRYVPLDPTRIVDTRNSNAAVGEQSSFAFAVAGFAGVPGTGAGSVVMNVTATEPTADSYLTVYPDGTALPLASNLNYGPGQTVPNLVIGRLGPNGYARAYNRWGSVHVVVDVSGYFTEVTFGFDTCEAPSISTMAAWRSASPFTSVGIYFGGGLRACTNRALQNPAWVNTVVAQGWRLIPIYVGAQAPCTTRSVRIDPANAFAWGVDAANDAAVQATNAGLPVGAPLYFDMEAYDNTDADCSLAVKQFIAGWATRLRELGYRSGFYSSLNSGIADIAKAANEGFATPDAIWVARWNDVPNIFGFPQDLLPDSLWAAHQRIHQYRGGHPETWGGVTITIDSNAVDGPLAP